MKKLLRVCEHLITPTKGKRSVVSLKKEGSHLILCAECYLSPDGALVGEADPQYFKELLREIRLAPAKPMGAC